MKKKLISIAWILVILLSSCSDVDEQRAYFTIEDSHTDLNFDLKGGTKTFTIKSNTDWKFVNTSGQTWATLSPMQGKGNAIVTLIVKESEISGRSVVFDIVPNGAKRSQFVITQGKGYEPDDENEFPIVAWTGINANESAAKFPLMKEAGINIYLGWYDNLATTLQVLDEAQKAGVKIIASCPELKTNVEATVKAMMDKPALHSYYIGDEPEVSELKGLGAWVSQIKAIDNRHPSYVNLYPNWAWGGTSIYAKNVQECLNLIPVSYISFDHYPIVSIDGAPTIIRPEWYSNLEDISSAARAKGIPFWAFALALSHNLDSRHFYPIPTLAELRLQVFSNLAYGAQGIQYFTYWGIFHDTPTIVYDRVKTVNQDIRNLSSVFHKSSVISVWHTGKQLPLGTHPVSGLPSQIKSLSTSDGGAVVSLLEKGENRFLVVVNRDYNNPMTLNVQLDSSVKQVTKTGEIVAYIDGEKRVEAGDIVIFTWKK